MGIVQSTAPSVENIVVPSTHESIIRETSQTSRETNQQKNAVRHESLTLSPIHQDNVDSVPQSISEQALQHSIEPISESAPNLSKDIPTTPHSAPPAKDSAQMDAHRFRSRSVAECAFSQSNNNCFEEENWQSSLDNWREKRRKATRSEATNLATLEEIRRKEAEKREAAIKDHIRQVKSQRGQFANTCLPPLDFIRSSTPSSPRVGRLSSGSCDISKLGQDTGEKKDLSLSDIPDSIGSHKENGTSPKDRDKCEPQLETIKNEAKKEAEKEDKIEKQEVNKLQQSAPVDLSQPKSTDYSRPAQLMKQVAEPNKSPASNQVNKDAALVGSNDTSTADYKDYQNLKVRLSSKAGSGEMFWGLTVKPQGPSSTAPFVIERIKIGSSADICELQKGDVLLSMDGVNLGLDPQTRKPNLSSKVGTMQDLESLMSRLVSTNKPITIQVLRKDDETDFLNEDEDLESVSASVAAPIHAPIPTSVQHNGTAKSWDDGGADVPITPVTKSQAESIPPCLVEISDPSRTVTTTDRTMSNISTSEPPNEPNICQPSPEKDSSSSGSSILTHVQESHVTNYASAIEFADPRKFTRRNHLFDKVESNESDIDSIPDPKHHKVVNLQDAVELGSATLTSASHSDESLRTESRLTHVPGSVEISSTEPTYMDLATTSLQSDQPNIDVRIKSTTSFEGAASITLDESSQGDQNTRSFKPKIFAEQSPVGDLRSVNSSSGVKNSSERTFKIAPKSTDFGSPTDSYLADKPSSKVISITKADALPSPPSPSLFAMDSPAKESQPPYETRFYKPKEISISPMHRNGVSQLNSQTPSKTGSTINSSVLRFPTSRGDLDISRIISISDHQTRNSLPKEHQPVIEYPVSVLPPAPPAPIFVSSTKSSTIPIIRQSDTEEGTIDDFDGLEGSTTSRRPNESQIPIRPLPPPPLFTSQNVENPPLPPRAPPLRTVNPDQKCAGCNRKLGFEDSMVIESLNLHYHLPCFVCARCGKALGDGSSDVEVRVRRGLLYCSGCHSVSVSNRNATHLNQSSSIHNRRAIDSSPGLRSPKTNDRRMRPLPVNHNSSPKHNLGIWTYNVKAQCFLGKF